MCKFYGFPVTKIHSAKLEYLPKATTYTYKGYALGLTYEFVIQMNRKYKPIYCGTRKNKTHRKLSFEECVAFVTAHEIFHLVQYREKAKETEIGANWAGCKFVLEHKLPKLE